MFQQVTAHLASAWRISGFHDLLPLLVLLTPALVILGLHYHQEWSVRRSFRRYWESAPKVPRPNNPGPMAPRKPLISQPRSLSAGAR